MVSCGTVSDIGVTSESHQVIKLPLLAAYLIQLPCHHHWDLDPTQYQTSSMEQGCLWSTTICHSIITQITSHITAKAHLFHCLESAQMTGLFNTLCNSKIEASVKCILHLGSILGWKWLFWHPSPDLLERKKISIGSTSNKECKSMFLILATMSTWSAPQSLKVQPLLGKM